MLCVLVAQLCPIRLATTTEIFYFLKIKKSKKYKLTMVATISLLESLFLWYMNSLSKSILKNQMRKKFSLFYGKWREKSNTELTSGKGN